MRNTGLTIFIVVLAVASGLLPAGAIADTVRLNRSVVIHGSEGPIRVGDVAQLIGANALQARDTELIAASEVRIGAEFEITLAQIREALARRDVNLGRIAMSGDRCRVFVTAPVDPQRDARDGDPHGADQSGTADAPGVWASDLMDQPTLRGQIARTVAGQIFDRDPNSIRITFSDNDRDQLDLSTTAHDFEILPQATSASSQIPFDVRVFQGERLVRTVRVVVQILLRQEVFVAQRYVARGEIIRPGDFVREIRMIEPHPIAPEAMDAIIEGQEARGRIVRGEILRVGQIVEPIVIQRNQEVDLVCKVGAFVVSQKVRALESGRTGEIIRVRLLTRRTELKARIEPEGSLSVIR